jgi:Epoxide hydrolase N terminus
VSRTRKYVLFVQTPERPEIRRGPPYAVACTRARSASPEALPLIITHGWPGSVVEFMNIIGPLTGPQHHGGNAEDAFHLLNMLFPYVREEPSDLTPVERERLSALRSFQASGSGYFALQSTKPQTLAYGLTDSPAGQLAWITEKFGAWTDGGLPGAVDRDGRVVGAAVLRDRPGARLGSCRALDGSYRRGGLPAGDRAADPALRGAVREHRALDRVRPRRSLRGHGGT